jgi:arylsulfatase
MTFSIATEAQAQNKPNILIVWGDDVGNTNISANTHGLMGYRTPNIDRIAREGMRFTDYYAEQSCTAGRSSFILGQSVYRTGLSKVGLPGAELGSHPDDPTIARLLKEQGYMTGQFGKNHLGDQDKHLPTSFSAICTTSTPRRSLKTRTIQATWSYPTAEPSARPSVRAA